MSKGVIIMNTLAIGASVLLLLICIKAVWVIWKAKQCEKNFYKDKKNG